MALQRTHLLRLAWKGGLFIFFLSLAVISPQFLVVPFTYKIWFFRVYHLLWIVVVGMLVRALFPRKNRNIASGKVFSHYYKEHTTLNTLNRKELSAKLRDYTRTSNRGAIMAAAFWAAILLIVTILSFSGIMDRSGLFLFVLFAYFLDEFCISVLCPFRYWLIKNRCCNVCRIHNWGSIMVFFVLVLIPSFWTYSVVFLAFLIFVQWEYLHCLHPERFYELCNANLMCKNCKTKAGRCAHESYHS
ncbi:hypothetical protein COY95_02675 [Candidatus Woesearchaeota archaeon CG_4_10_14_0_8_um_filter_47_5]|nr:MAG: hypothetical protein COY95_02675 [Candidatus Woesearchaeota archaeon CG_4_10_14_0_8_um_filter_47_5]